MARARNPKGLTDQQVTTLREALAANRRPLVTLQGNQFGDDARGQVVAVGDAAVDGEEFISVRVKLAGVSDTLTFSPDELTLPGGVSKSSPATPRGVTRSRSAAATTVSASPTVPPAKAVPSAKSPAAAVKAAAPPRVSAPPLPQHSSAEAIPMVSAPQPATRRVSGKRKAAAVTVTVSSSGHSWTLSASRGGRSLLKATPVSAGVVTAVTALFADPALTEAVADINQVALAEAQQRADTLRRELAAVESILQSYQQP